MSSKKLFGANITPDCEYCLYCDKSGKSSRICSFSSQPAERVCGRYVYDPLKREPRATPAMPEFTAEDFKL